MIAINFSQQKESVNFNLISQKRHLILSENNNFELQKQTQTIFFNASLQVFKILTNNQGNKEISLSIVINIYDI